MVITADGQPVGRSTTYRVTVEHSDFWPAATILSGAELPAVAGQPVKLLFSVFDRFGNPYLSPDLSFGLWAEHDSGSNFVTGEVSQNCGFCTM